MKILFLMIFALLGVIQNNTDCSSKNVSKIGDEIQPAQTKQAIYEHLPENITPETKVKNDVVDKKGRVISSEITTVEKALKKLRAKYKKNKLLDNKGKEIKFFSPLCRGASQGFEADRQVQLEKEKELQELRKNYTVIVIFCDPTQVL